MTPVLSLYKLSQRGKRERRLGVGEDGETEQERERVTKGEQQGEKERDPGDPSW